MRFFTNDQAKRNDDLAYQQKQAEKQSALSGRVVPEDLKGTIYEDMALNNPYANMYYEPTFWDIIGLSNKAKDTNAEYQRLYNEYIAGIYDQKRQDEYNSPVEQAERMRLAGQNPDLLGTSGVSPTDEMNPNHAPQNPALDGSAPALNAMSMMSNVIGFAVSSLKQFSEIQNLSLQGSATELELFKNMTPLVSQSISNEFAKRFAGRAQMSWNDVKSQGQEAFYGNKRLSRHYGRAFDHFLRSNEFIAQQNAYDSLSANDRAMHHYTKKIAELEVGYLAKKYSAGSSEESLSKFLADWRNDLYKTLKNDMDSGSTIAPFLIIGQSEMLPSLFSAGGDIVESLLNKLPSLSDIFFKKKFKKVGRK